MRPLSKLEQLGLIKTFEVAHELGWNVMRDYFYGPNSIMGARAAIREALDCGLITDGEGWMEMTEGRQMPAEIYNEEKVDNLSVKIVDVYAPLLQDFQARMQELKG